MAGDSMVKIDNLSIRFNLAKERVDSLKEYFIKFAKGSLEFEEFWALKDISVDIKKGDVYGLVGLNGSGKSTLLKVVAGVLKPTKGSCMVNGTIAPLIELGAGFDMDLTARENIFLNGAILGFSKQHMLEKFDDIVAFSELHEFLDVPLKIYSSGM
ncbi:MAG: ATP-binding cassette domain-containing protein, partial [Oscillospiraceae bacterium]